MEEVFGQQEGTEVKHKICCFFFNEDKLKNPYVDDFFDQWDPNTATPMEEVFGQQERTEVQHKICSFFFKMRID